jgi:phosphonoacetaldehyde hydrolase
MSDRQATPHTDPPLQGEREISVRLVVFDWAGTAIDFGCHGPTAAFVRAFSTKGVEVTPAEARGPMGLHKRDHLRVMLEDPAVAAKWRAAAGHDPTPDDVEDLYRLVTPLQVEAAAQGALVPGLLDAVAWLRDRGIAIGTTTGYFRAAADACLAAAKRQGFAPDVAVCADDVPAGRPAPWMIFRAMEAVGVYPPTAVAKLGDTVPDIEEGLHAGAWAVGLVDGSSEMGLTEAEFATLTESDREARRESVREKFLAAGADAVIDNFDDLPELIDALNEQLK